MIDGQRTKIVCTVGPATEDDNVLRDMMLAGMNVARLNFSHGSYDYHRTNIERVRRIAGELGIDVAILVDTKGPEIRTRLNKDHKPIAFEDGAEVVITANATESTRQTIAIDYASLSHEVEPGSAIYIDDGLMRFEVKRIEGDDIHCVLSNAGTLGERKGVNVPDVKMELPAVTDQDRKDIRFACKMEVDAVAASFIRDAQAVEEVRALCTEYGCEDMFIISKIESSLALNNFDAILEASDAIMVARGDLGVEIPPAKVPQVQKKIIKLCNNGCKPVITATQMLESMRYSPRPTRAEVTDVANAIYDGTDCVMLSGETAAGAYPVESVRMMAEVCRQAEQHLPRRKHYNPADGKHNVSGAASYGASEIADHVGAVAIVCPTNSGRTARIMSSYRPPLPILATTANERTVRRTSFYWGVRGILTKQQDGLAPICYDALKIARRSGFVKVDDLVVITAGDPITSPFTKGSETTTNVCMIAQVF